MRDGDIIDINPLMNYYRVGACVPLMGQLRHFSNVSGPHPSSRFYDEKQKHRVQMVFNCLETHYGRLVIVSHKK